MRIEDVINNLIGMEITDDYENDIICAFENYEFSGETEIMVSPAYCGYQAYANHKDAPIVIMKVEDNKIVDAWKD